MKRSRSDRLAWALKVADAARFARLYSYAPYPKQRVFHDLGGEKRERLLMAGSQLGKCNLITSFFTDRHGRTRQIGDLLGSSRMVPIRSMGPDGKLVDAEAFPFFKKSGLHACYRVFLSDGSWMEIAGGHRILTASGWRTFESLRGSYADLRETISGSSPKARAADARRWFEIAGGWTRDCLPDRRSCDERLLRSPEIDRWISPLGDDARQRSLSWCSSGDQEDGGSSSGLRECARPSSSDGGVLGVDPRVGFGGREPCSVSRWPRGSTRNAQRTPSASTPSLRSALGVPEDRAFSRPVSIDGNRIIAYESLGLHEVYDTTVPRYANYVTHGLVHHNTYAGASEMAYHLTGLYPEWWKGRRFEHPILAWAGGVNNEHTRNNLQRLLFGKNLGDELGTGMIPGDAIQHYSLSRGMSDFIDQAFIRHVSGGTSQLALKSYEQGFRKWEGASVHVVWCDEEAPKDIYVSAQARTTATGGLLYTTFTPLLGMTEIVGWFFPQPNEPHRGLVQLGIEDAAHIPPERVAEEIAKYPEHEREARVKGIPALGSGRVFPVAESAIVIPPFELPSHWPRIAGIDFGWDHPTAVAWLAWDRDHDAVVLYAEHRLSEAVPAVHADAIRARGSWIPVSWPHDGMVSDKGSGVPLMEQYRAKGVRMLPTHASFASSARQGPQKSHPEAGCHEMLTMMKEGRFKIFASCPMWLEEFRIYHRLEGKIVAKRDDLISASRYATIMRRYARTEPVPLAHRETPPPGTYDPLEVLQ